MNDMLDKATGGSLCEAVRFAACNVPATFGIRHCTPCHRWTGSALCDVSVKTDDRDAFTLIHGIFVDHAPAGPRHGDDRGQKRLTRDDVVAINPTAGAS